MEDTCRGEQCWFYILMKDLTAGEPKSLEFKNCPFYQETIWTPISVGSKPATPKVIHDCANKRGLLVLLGDVVPRVVAVQKANEQARNKSTDLVNIVTEAVNMSLKKTGNVQINSRRIGEVSDTKIFLENKKEDRNEE